MKIDNNIEKYVFGDTTFLLEDFKDGKGELIVLHDDTTVSYYWGSMGSNLKEFLSNASYGYILDKLFSNKTDLITEYDEEATLAEIKEYNNYKRLDDVSQTALLESLSNVRCINSFHYYLEEANSYLETFENSSWNGLYSDIIQDIEYVYKTKNNLFYCVIKENVLHLKKYLKEELNGL